jgi:hypothetical protein
VERLAPAEQAAVRVLLWATTGVAASVPVLVLPAPEDPLLPATAHLSAVVLFSVALSFHLASLIEGDWFSPSSLSPTARRALGGVWLVVLVAGSTGVVTLATGAAYRFDASLQYLQVLSALDVAWVEAALVIGLQRRFGPRVALAGALAMAGVCVWSIWRYLDVVGFTASGGWLVDGGEIARLILPFDAMAAVIAVAAFAAGVRSDGSR